MPTLRTFLLPCWLGLALGPAGSATAAPPTAAAPAAEPASAPPPPAEVLGIDSTVPEHYLPTPPPATNQAWVLEMPSPMRRTRGGSAPGEITTTTYRRATPVLGGAAAQGSAVVFRPGDARLAALAREEQEFYDALAREPDQWPQAERDKRGQEINDAYVKYLTTNSGDVLALILYGKFLRRVGEREQAYAVFQRAYRLDPKVAVVNQQIAAHLAEDGEFAGAVGFLLRAVELAPAEPLYQYQLGEVLDVYYDLIIKDRIYSVPQLNASMAGAFARAAELNPREPAFVWRQADCYYDMLDPDWAAALAAWDRVAARLAIPLERDVVRLHRARCLLELGRLDEARALVEQPAPALLDGVRAELRARLAATAPAPASAPSDAPAPASATPIPSAPPGPSAS